MPEFLFFDVGGTLLHFAPSHAVVVGEAVRELGLEISAERAIDVVRAARTAHGGRPDPVDLEANRVWWLGLFERIAREVDSDRSDQLRDELYARHRAGDWLQPASDTLSTLEVLATSGHRMAVISNWDDTLPAILERRGLLRHFEFVVCSADRGFAKPDRRIFDEALAEAGVDANQAVHIGDEFEADVRGAIGAGIRPIHLAVRGNAMHGERVDTIARLAELLEFLR